MLQLRFRKRLLNDFSLDVSRNSVYLLKYPCSDGKTCSPYETTLPIGAYLLEAWGAQGGNTNKGGVGGKGGYSRGILTLKKETKVFIHIGGQPENTQGQGSEVTIYGGYNGGGSAAETSSCNGGGGGTDFRLNENTLYHRVLVAGGGGGSPASSSYSNYFAGAGGGLEGQASGWGPTTNGGKQYQGGTGGYVGSSGTQGSFGIGGNHGYESAGGGGGWYGGSGSSNNGANIGAAGGSGYVFSSSSYKSSDFKLTSEYYLVNETTIQGTLPFLSPDGLQETGHTGHGAAKITIIHAKSLRRNFCTKKCSPHHPISIAFFMILVS